MQNAVLNQYQLQQYSSQIINGLCVQLEIKIQQGLYHAKSQVRTNYINLAQNCVLINVDADPQIDTVPAIYTRSEFCPLVYGQCQIGNQKNSSIFQVENLAFHQLNNYKLSNQKDQQINQQSYSLYQNNGRFTDNMKQTSLSKIGNCCSIPDAGEQVAAEKIISVSKSYKFTDFFPKLINDEYFLVENTLIFRITIDSATPKNTDRGLQDGLCKGGAVPGQITQLTNLNGEQFPEGFQIVFDMLRYNFNPLQREIQPIYRVTQTAFMNQTMVNYVIQQDCLVQINLQQTDSPLYLGLSDQQKFDLHWCYSPYNVDDLYDYLQFNYELLQATNFNIQVINNLNITFRNRQIINAITQQQSRQQFSILKKNEIYQDLSAELGFALQHDTVQILSSIPYNIYITTIYI